MNGYFLVAAIVLGIPQWFLTGQTASEKPGEIKYISQKSYYINLGSRQGLSVGDTLVVRRNKRLIGRLAVESLSKVSGACKLIFQTQEIKQGDRVHPLHANSETDLKPAVANPMLRTGKPESKFRTSRGTKRKSKERRRRANRVTGRVGLQAVLLDDMSASDYDYNQFGLRGKIVIQKFLSLPLDLRMRWRTRAHYRDRPLGADLAENELTNRVYEFGLVSSRRDANYEFGFGRILSHRIRGLGYIDGALFSFKLHESWRVGVAGGTQPSLRRSSFRTSEQKYGLFVNFERGEYRTQRLSSTVAFSGRYNRGEVSREFVYVQNTYSLASRLSVYQTVEIDINRGWKKEFDGKEIQFTNFFLSANYASGRMFSMNVSYDARKNIRVFETRSIPDSLFDQATRQGLRARVTLRLPRRIRFSGGAGIRFLSGGIKNTVSASGALTVREIFNTRATFNARLSYFSTMFTKGYRPSLGLRLPVMRGLSVNLSAGSYLYRRGDRLTQNNWLETRGYFRINRRFFGNFGYRLFVDERLKSGRLFVETGVVF